MNGALYLGKARRGIGRRIGNRRGPASKGGKLRFQYLVEPQGT